MSTYTILKGKDLEVRVNTQYILAYSYDRESDETLVWLLGVDEAIRYPGDQRKAISLSVASS